MSNSAWSSKCDHPDCDGHLGKFSSCLDEAVWQASMDGGETTGSVEAYGHYTLLEFPVPEDIRIDDGVVVSVPAGWYMVEATDQGFVYVSEYGSDGARAKAEWAAHEREYGEWLDVNEPEEF